MRAYVPAVDRAHLARPQAEMPALRHADGLEQTLRPKADPKQHPEAFYHGLRLCGTDGSNFSLANTPQVKKTMTKAISRRAKAAFAKIGVSTLIELGLHNPIGAAIALRGESEMALAHHLIHQLPEKSLWINDRYYGVPCVVSAIAHAYPEGGREFLLRARRNLKARVV